MKWIKTATSSGLSGTKKLNRSRLLCVSSRLCAVIVGITGKVTDQSHIVVLRGGSRNLRRLGDLLYFIFVSFYCVCICVFCCLRFLCFPL